MNAGSSAIVQPVAPYTWEIQATLDGSTLETRRIPCRWQRPVRIVGMYASVINDSSTALLLSPTVDDILAMLSVNQKDRYTNRLEDVTPTGMGEAYVTLGALSTSQLTGGRLLDLRLDVAAPQLDVGFRWKRDPTGGPYYQDAIVCLSLFCAYLND